MVVSVVYLATSALMKKYYTEPSRRNVPTLHATAATMKETRRRTVSRRTSLVDLEVTKVLREIERTEGKPVRALTAEEVSKHVNVLSEIATNSAAKQFVASSISRSEAQNLLAELNQSHR